MTENNQRKIEITVTPIPAIDGTTVYQYSTNDVLHDAEGENIFTIEKQIVDGIEKDVCIDEDPEKRAKFHAMK
jgi:hypothetical protein